MRGFIQCLKRDFEWPSLETVARGDIIYGRGLCMSYLSRKIGCWHAFTYGQFIFFLVFHVTENSGDVVLITPIIYSECYVVESTRIKVVNGCLG